MFIKNVHDAEFLTFKYVLHSSERCRGVWEQGCEALRVCLEGLFLCIFLISPSFICDFCRTQ